MVRGLAPRNLALNDLRKLKKKVNKNTKILSSREIGRLRVDMDTGPSTTANVERISALAQGDDEFNRHGNKVHATHVSCRGSIIMHASSAQTRVRFVLLRDKLGSTVPPTLLDVFTSEGHFFDNKHRRDGVQEMKRFDIIWDKYIILNEAFDGAVPAASWKFSKKLNFDILFTGTAATNEGKNMIYLLSGSDEPTSVPVVAGDVMFRYTDL